MNTHAHIYINLKNELSGDSVRLLYVYYKGEIM